MIVWNGRTRYNERYVCTFTAALVPEEPPVSLPTRLCPSSNHFPTPPIHAVRPLVRSFLFDLRRRQLPLFQPIASQALVARPPDGSSVISVHFCHVAPVERAPHFCSAGMLDLCRLLEVADALRRRMHLEKVPAPRSVVYRRPGAVPSIEFSQILSLWRC